MPDTTNTEPPLPEKKLLHPFHKDGDVEYDWRGCPYGYTESQILAYGDARAAHAVAQAKAITRISIPTEVMEQEFQLHYTRGFKAGKDAATPREVTDAEIEALAADVIGRAGSQWMNLSRHEMHRLVRAAIALANGRG